MTLRMMLADILEALFDTKYQSGPALILVWACIGGMLGWFTGLIIWLVKR